MCSSPAMVPFLLCQRLSVVTFPAVSTVVCWSLPCCVHCCLLVPSLLCQRLSVGPFPAVSTAVCWYLHCCVNGCLLVPSLLCQWLSVGTFTAVSTVVCWSTGHVPILLWPPMVGPAVYLLVTLTACSHCCCRLPLVIPQRGCNYICTRVVKMYFEARVFLVFHAASIIHAFCQRDDKQTVQHWTHDM